MNINKELLKSFLLEEESEENIEEDVSTSEYEKIIDNLGDFLSELDPDSLSEAAQATLFILYDNLSDIYDLDEEEIEEDDTLVEYKVRRISKSKHRKSHLNYLKMKRKKGTKMKMKAKLARKTAKYKTWAKRYKMKKKAGRTGKIRYS